MKNISLLLIKFTLIGCGQKVEEVAIRSSVCPGRPSFMAQKTYTPNVLLAFSTTEARDKGLWLVDENIKPPNAGRLLFQDSSWNDAGWLGSFLTDKNGNIWCTPVPVINVLDNPTEKQNTLWRVDSKTGKMEPFITLPDADRISPENPYGILAVTYNCESNVLYITTAAGSNRKSQNGKIYCVDVVSKKILSTLNTGDVFGVGMSYKNNFRKLYFGSARNSDVYSVHLNEDGTFNGKPTKAFSIAGLGPRGDDIARKIKEDQKTGELWVTGTEFKFNLTAPTEIQSNIYRFKYNAGQEQWELVQ